ncbi:MAG: TolC family protein [Roseimicrobium sp.]
MEQAYTQGQTDLLTVLRVREQLLKLQTTALDSLRDYHLARIRYEAVTGKP